MPSVSEYQSAIRALLSPLAAREPEWWTDPRPPAAPAPRVLAADVSNPLDLPPFDNSQMDGYAVRAAEVHPGSALAVAPHIAAGAGLARLKPGTAAPIMTGAAVPLGADAIIPIEASDPNSFLPDEPGHSVRFAGPVEPGAFVRRRSSDLAAGQMLLIAGTVLGPAHWGVLASAGVTRVPLLRRVRVLLISTGDELRAPEAPLDPATIHDANGASLTAALEEAGAEVVRAEVVRDDAVAARALLAEVLASTPVDLILSTGGVSAGAYEVVRDVFESAGVAFTSVSMQPGGPQGQGVARLDGADLPVVAFPGNPVSALVSFEMFLRPVLRGLHGLPAQRPVIRGPLVAAVESPVAKHQVRRGRLRPDGSIELVGGPGSHLLHSYAASDLLVHLPVGVHELPAGATVDAWAI